MNIPSLGTTPVGQRPVSAPAAQQAGPEGPTETFVSHIPAFAKSALDQLLHGQLPPGVSKGELTPAAQQEAGKAAFAASMLSSSDEVAGKDEAMGQPGKVIQNGLTCEFVSAGPKQIEAILYGKNDPSGLPAALYVKAGPEGIQSYGMLDHGSSVEIKGQFMTPVAPKQFEGYVVAGSTPAAE